MRADRLPGLRGVPPRLRRVDPRVVLFQSWGGRLADSPRAIAEEMRRRDAPFDQMWVLNDPSRAPAGARTVRPGSAAYLAELGRAGHIVSSNIFPNYFRKKRGMSYLQTWHGTPLKRIAFDIERPTFRPPKRYLAALRREVARWDHLLSPNGFSTDVLRRAFRYEGRILETGYPRNDVLSSPEREEIRRRARSELGIDDATCAVLYAPTWRDTREFSPAVDVPALASRLGDRFAILLRAHRSVATTPALSAHERVHDVSAVDDIGELLLAADVLVTDYSSVMFDFAVTGKPIVLFTYDLDHYANELRGLYFDLEAEGPGPLVHTAEDLVDALTEIESVRSQYEAAYGRFRRRFCHLDDGRAAERVVDAVFGPA